MLMVFQLASLMPSLNLDMTETIQSVVPQRRMSKLFAQQGFDSFKTAPHRISATPNVSPRNRASPSLILGQWEQVDTLSRGVLARATHPATRLH
jgi:hypothetical protein